MNTIVQNPTRQKCFTEAVFVAPLLIAAHLKACYIAQTGENLTLLSGQPD
jgi:hypothetical protein